MIEIEAPDGTVVEFPDGTAPDVMKSAMQRKYGVASPQERKMLADISNPEKSVGINESLSTPLQLMAAARGIYMPVPKGGTGGTSRVSRVAGQFLDPMGLSDETAGIVAGAKEIASAPTRASWWGGEEEPLLDRVGRAYSDTAGSVRAERSIARDRNTLLPEILGGLAQAPLTPIVGASRTAISAGRPIVNRLLNAATNASIYGAISGAAQGDDLGSRSENALYGGATGAVAGPVISEVLIPGAIQGGRAMNWAGQRISNALEASRNPEEAAYRTVADKMLATGIEPSSLRAQVAPPTSAALQKRGLSQDDMATIISRGLSGESPVQIGSDYGIAPDTVRAYTQKYIAENPTQLNLVDITKEVAGKGKSGPMTRLARAAYGLSGDESAEAGQALIDRQLGQPGRVSSIINESVGGRDYEGMRKAAETKLEQEAGAAYRQFRAEPELAINNLADLMEDPLFRRASIQAQRQARVEAIRRNQDALRKGIAPEPVPSVDPETEVFSPELLDLIQRQLRITGEGVANNPNAARHAQNLRRVFLDRIQEHYPSFQGIRTNYAEGKMAQEALDAGASLVTNLGAPARDALREFASLTPAQQEMFRIGFAQKMLAMAGTTKEGAAVANRFNTPNVRQTIEAIFPRSDKKLYARGQRLIRDLRREALTTETKNDILSGSRTAEYASDMGRLGDDAKIAADAMLFRWSSMLQGVASKLATQLNQKAATEVMKITTEADPSKVLRVLNRLAKAAATSKERNAYREAIVQMRRVNAARTAPAVGVASGTMQSDQR